MNEVKRIRALLADDEPHIRALVKALLSKIGMDVVAEASNGVEAVDLFKSHQPDILFLDVNMPLKTGDEALKEIMTISPDACVVMLTSVSDMENVERCIELGAANYIRKDTPLDEMKVIIGELSPLCSR